MKGYILLYIMCVRFVCLIIAYYSVEINGLRINPFVPVMYVYYNV